MSAFTWNSKTTLEVLGHTLEAISYGPEPKDALTIVLLHEGLGCVDLWHDFPRQLSERTGCGVFAYSRAGYGASSSVALPRPLDYMSQEAIEALPVILNTIGAERVALLGHSDGASIAAIYAGSVVDYRVRAVGLIAPHFFTEQIALTAIAAAKDSYINGNLKQKLGKYHHNVDNAFYGWNSAWLDADFVDWNIAECIDYLRVPVLAIQGADDQYGTLAQIDEIEQRCYSPVEKHIISDCRHAPHLENPDETLSVITEFIDRLERIDVASVIPPI